MPPGYGGLPRGLDELGLSPNGSNDVAVYESPLLKKGGMLVLWPLCGN